MKIDYFVQYGVNFSHMTECKVFKLYGDAKSFFDKLDKELYQAAVCYKQHYSKNSEMPGWFADSTVEYKLYYFAEKRNSLLLEKIRSGNKFISMETGWHQINFHKH